MAFVRWRGNSATLLTTVYKGGRSQQVLLAALGTGYSVSSSVRESVTRRFAQIPVDWAADSSPYPAEANLLLATANVLTERRSRAKG